MITINLKGGLGNQLFHYALGCAYEARGHEVQYATYIFDLDTTRIYLLPKLGLKLPLVERGNGTVIEDGNLSYKPEILDLSPKQDWVLDGYWQSEKYFMDVRDRIHREVFSGMLHSRETLVMAERIRTTPCSSFLHVRRTDNVSIRALAFHALLGEDYYSAASTIMKYKFPDVHFYVFSDDPAYIRGNYGGIDTHTLVDFNPMSGTVDENYVIHKGTIGREVEDLYLMAQCKHAIIANSTFSWWGAWLREAERLRNPGTVIRPAAWFVVDPKLADSSNIIPERWLPV